MPAGDVGGYINLKSCPRMTFYRESKSKISFDGSIKRAVVLESQITLMQLYNSTSNIDYELLPANH